MAKPKTVWDFIAQKPCAACGAVLLTFMQAAFNIAEVIILEHFIDSFSAESSSSVFHWGQAVTFAVILSGIYAFYYIQTPLFHYLNEKIRLQMRAGLDCRIIKKTARISVEAIEHSENQALLARLKDEPEKRYANGFFSLLRILGGAFGITGVFILLIDSVPSFLLVILVLLGLMVITFRLIGKNKVKLYRTRQEIGRRSDYLSGLLFERQLAQEKKLFGYTHYIQKLYEEENVKSDRQMFTSIFASNIALWLYDNITYLFSASAYLLFLIPLSQGKMDIGLYIAIIPALARLGNFFVLVGSSYLPAYKEYLACLEDMEKLDNLPEQYYDNREAKTLLSEEFPSFHTIKGENIVFRYPGQEKPVLNGLNFTFQTGRNYALVGENGCGKTTFIKLLMGFYKPERGSITIDGKNIQEMDFKQLQHFFSAVFQDFNRYHYTVRENILISDLGEKEQTAKMWQAAKEAELEEWISSCEKTYDTKLGNLEEGSVNISGGQWQRLSIARMLYRRAGIYIWDEPTAAMDPLAESRLYTAFLQKRSESCANIFVTHRLGAAVNADEICVMEDGRFVEWGQHTQLMQKENGLYRRMLEAQKGMYQ